MKQVSSIIFFCLSMCCGIFAYGKASTDLSALPDDTRALIMKERMRTQGVNSDKNQAADSTNASDPFNSKKTTLIDGGISSGCDINIGNSKSKPGMNSKPTTVIITGPVIQMPGKGCK
jgi:hypothetical protein